MPNKLSNNKSKLVANANFKQQLEDISYKTGADLEAAKTKFIENNANWKVLKDSTSELSSVASQFNAVAFINETTKEVVIAHAGTKVSPDDLKQSMQDLWADAQLTAKVTPNSKFAAIKSFVTQVCDMLPEVPEGEKEYQFSTTGHSLGGVLADLTAVELSARGMNVTDSITFDNPGSKPIIEHALKNKLFANNNKSVDNLKEEIEFISIQAQNPNLVSRTNEQMGKSFVKVNALKESNGQTAEQDLGADYVSYLYNKIGTVVDTAALALNLKNLTTSYEAIRNFYDPIKFGEFATDLADVTKGIGEKFINEMYKPYENIKNDVIDVIGNLGIIGASAIAAANGGSYWAGLGISRGVLGLGFSLNKLAGDLPDAYGRLVTFANSAAVLGGHSLSNFTDITENNLLPVHSGLGIEGKKLTVYSNDTEKELEKCLKIIANREKAVEIALADEAKDSSWGSWIKNKVTSTLYGVKDAVVAHTKDLIEVNLVIGNQVFALTHSELQLFSSNSNIGEEFEPLFTQFAESDESKDLGAEIESNDDTGPLYIDAKELFASEDSHNVLITGEDFFNTAAAA